MPIQTELFHGIRYHCDCGQPILHILDSDYIYYPCPKCNARLSFGEAVRKASDGEGEHVFVFDCDECGRNNVIPFDFKEHLKNHIASLPTFCVHCKHQGNYWIEPLPPLKLP